MAQCLLHSSHTFSQIGHMVVTSLTKSPRQVHLNNVAELAYEPGKSSVYHIPSKTFDGEKDGYIFKTGDVGLGYYYDDNLEMLKLDRLH
jgi:hypothetical protein